MRPKWEYTRIEQDNTCQAVEILLEMENAFNILTPETAAKFKQTQKQDYILSKTCLIYSVHKKTGVEEMFLMTIIPDLAYLESTRFEPFKKMSYLKIDSKFEGLIMYYDLQGNYMRGLRYKSGKAVGTVSELSEKTDFDLVTTRSGNCDFYYTISMYQMCYDFYMLYSGEMTYMYSSCNTPWEVFENFYVLCDLEDEGGGGDPPGGGGNPGGGNIMAVPNIPSTMTPQLTNTCVTAIMEYINNQIFGGNTNEGVYILSYLLNFGGDVLANGVYVNDVEPFVKMHFTTTSYPNWMQAIYNGAVIMTNIGGHNVLVVGYQMSTNSYIYMDPETGCFETAQYNNFTRTYEIYITGIK